MDGVICGCMHTRDCYDLSRCDRIPFETDFLVSFVEVASSDPSVSSLELILSSSSPLSVM